MASPIESIAAGSPLSDKLGTQLKNGMAGQYGGSVKLLSTSGTAEAAVRFGSRKSRSIGQMPNCDDSGYPVSVRTRMPTSKAYGSRSRGFPVARTVQ